MGPGPTSTAPPAMAAMTSSASPWRPILEPPPRLHSSSSGLATPPRSCEARRQHLPPPTPPVRAEAAARHRAVAVPVHPHRAASPLHLSRRDLGGKEAPNQAHLAGARRLQVTAPRRRRMPSNPEPRTRRPRPEEEERGRLAKIPLRVCLFRFKFNALFNESVFISSQAPGVYG